MLRYWFIPCWSGDFRLERDGADACLLTVEDPTAADRRLLEPFVVEMRKRKLVDELTGIQPAGLTEIKLAAPMQDLAPLLAHAIHGDAETWVALRSADGKVELADGGELVTVEPDTVAAVTVKKPKRGCPMPEACNRRASEVLKAFSTRRQWSQWQAEGRMQAQGHQSGQLYFIYHRDEAAARGISRSMTLADGTPVCAWDDTVPSEEEALALKLGVEHRESHINAMLRLPLGRPRPGRRHPSIRGRRMHLLPLLD